MLIISSSSSIFDHYFLISQTRPLFVYFHSFRKKNIAQFWKCAWDSNPGRQDGSCRRIHWAIAATLRISSSNTYCNSTFYYYNKVSPKSPRLLGSNGMLGGSRSTLSRVFVESVPEYRHEPPKTPPHILLHYSPFKVRPSQSWTSISKCNPF